MRYLKQFFSPSSTRNEEVRSRRLFAIRAALLLGVVMLPIWACFVPLEPEAQNKCQSGSCWIRSASVCCPSGYLNYAGAGYGCYTTQQACLNASGGKCWWETSCIP